MRILAVGDVTGKAGCEYLREVLPSLKKEKRADFCIVNGENSAPYNGIVKDTAESILSSGADVITLGNHSFRHREFYDYLDNSESVIRPANFKNSVPGKGFLISDLGKYSVLTISLQGTMYMDSIDNPFFTIDKILEDNKSAKIIIVDFHAETTSEKRAMGFYLDGRVSAVFGTHTHVQTADEQILENGTGYITDVGMTGPKDSVLGVDPKIIIEKFKYNMPQRFECKEGACMLCGIIFDIDEKTGKTISVERICI